MNYYEVLVTQEYSARESVFTYASPYLIALYSFVQVPLQKGLSMGIIVRKTSEPSFKTKQISKHYPYYLLPNQRTLVRFMTRYYGANEFKFYRFLYQIFCPANFPRRQF